MGNNRSGRTRAQTPKKCTPPKKLRDAVGGQIPKTGTPGSEPTGSCDSLQDELRYEASLIQQASFMTAAFSFSSNALFAVWKMGVEQVKTVPKGVMHICIGSITIFLLFSVLFSVRALLHSYPFNMRYNVEELRASNKKRYRLIKWATTSWGCAFVLVFVIVAFLAIHYYILAGYTNRWLT